MVGLAAPCSDTEDDCLANGSEDDEEFDSDEDYAANRKTKESGTLATKSAPKRMGSSLSDESVLVKSEPNESSTILKRKKGPERKMGGLSLPDVVRELLKERDVLRWDAADCLYEVLNGEKFESRFNDLRRVRNKAERASGTERPFSRMHNFFALEVGDKWARTGTKFRPLGPRGFPPPEIVKRGNSPEKRASLSSRAIPLTSRSALSNVRPGYVPSHGPAHHETTAYGMPAAQYIPAISARAVAGNMGRYIDVPHDEYSHGRRSHGRRSDSPQPITPVPIGKRKHHVLGVSDAFLDVDSTDEEGGPAVSISKEEEVTDEGLIPSHLIDVVAQRLLSKRPRPLVSASQDRHFMEGRDSRFQNSRYSSWTSHCADGRGSNGDYLSQSYGHRPSPDVSFSTPPMPSYSHNSDKPSALPAWLLMEAEAAAVAAAAADRRVARYLGLLGAAVGAEAVGGHPSTDHSNSYDMSYNAPEAEPWSAPEYNSRSQNSLRRESWTSAEAVLRLSGASGPESRGSLSRGLCLQSPLEDTPVGRRHGAHNDACVYEISSEGGSCQPSPEGPVLSLCGDLGEDHGYRTGAGDALTPLELGDPAIDPAAARPAARTMVTAPLVAEESDIYGDSGGLDLGCGSNQTYHLVCAAVPSLDCSTALGERSSNNENPIRRKEPLNVSEAAMTADEGVLCGLGAAYCEGSDFPICMISGSGGGSGSGECDAWLTGCGRGSVPIVDNVAAGGSLIGDFDGGTWDALYNRDDDCSGWW